jgi:hypothetical protein
MKRNMKRAPLAIMAALCLASAAASGETTEQLQQRIIDLQSQLLACQGSGKSAVPDSMKEALEAFQTFSSTVDTNVNYTAYRDALVPLKVKVDRLPAEASTVAMKKTVEMFVDAGTLWNISIVTRGRGVFSYEAAPILEKYGVNVKQVNTLLDVVGTLVHRGQNDIRMLRLSAPDPSPSEPRCVVNGKWVPCSAEEQAKDKSWSTPSPNK